MVCRCSRATLTGCSSWCMTATRIIRAATPVSPAPSSCCRNPKFSSLREGAAGALFFVMGSLFSPQATALPLRVSHDRFCPQRGDRQLSPVPDAVAINGDLKYDLAICKCHYRHTRAVLDHLDQGEQNGDVAIWLAAFTAARAGEPARRAGICALG